MSGAVIASLLSGLPATVQFITSQFVNNGNDTTNAPVYSVPSGTRVGDIVLFYCLSNSAGQGSTPPGAGWTNASGSLGGSDAVYVKRMGAAGDLSATTSGSGGYLAFAVYRGAATFAVVSGTGFNKSQYYAGVTFFGAAKPSPTTQRFTLISNSTIGSAIASDILPPLVYANGSNYNQYTAVEFRSQ